MNLVQKDTEVRLPPEPNSVTRKTETACRFKTIEKSPTKLQDVNTEKQ